jgi:hypothetical protein
MRVHFEVGLTTGGKITAEMKRLEAENEDDTTIKKAEHRARRFTT